MAWQYFRRRLSKDAQFSAGSRKSVETKKKIHFGLEIVPKRVSGKTASRFCSERESEPIEEKSNVETWASRLKSEDSAIRVEAAWHLMTAKEPVPIEILTMGLKDSNTDVRWYMTEALQKCIDIDKMIQLAVPMLSDQKRVATRLQQDQARFGRMSAVDALVTAGDDALDAIWDGVFDGDAFREIDYAIDKICRADRDRLRRSFVRCGGGAKIAKTLQKAFDNRKAMKHRIQHLRRICKCYGISEHEAFGEIVGQLIPKILRDFSEGQAKARNISMLSFLGSNGVIERIIINEIAGTEAITPDKEFPQDNTEHIQLTVRSALIDMSAQQNARILVVLMCYGQKRWIEPSVKALSQLSIGEVAEAVKNIVQQGGSKSSRYKQIINLLKQLD